MEPILEKEVRDLEDQAAYLKGEKARILKEKAASALARAEASHAGTDLLDRLDILLVNLTEASRDVCTNTRCPHYGKKMQNEIEKSLYQMTGISGEMKINLF